MRKSTAHTLFQRAALIALLLRSTTPWAATEEPPPAPSSPPDVPRIEPEGPKPAALAPAPLPRHVPAGGIWIHPITAAAFGSAGTLYVPVGGWIALSPEVDLAFELAPLNGTNVYDRAETHHGVWTSLGISIHSAEQEGIFVQPKVQFAWFDENYDILVNRYQPPVAFHEWSRQLTLGADVGYQVRWGALYAALMVGIWAGYGQNVPTEGPIEPYLRFLNIGLRSGPPRANQPVSGLNLNLLRVGFAF
jgi:hypothetical protein